MQEKYKVSYKITKVMLYSETVTRDIEIKTKLIVTTEEGGWG